MKKVSVIIPMYNVEQYIEKCILSVYKQQMTHEEFEVILIDDESPDNSLSVAKKIVERYQNVKIISQKNKGLGGARNTGITNAEGAYLLFLDADDFYVDNAVPELLRIAKKNNLDILEFGAHGIDTKHNITYELAKDTNGTVLSGIKYYNSLKYMNSACNKLYKRSFLEMHKLEFVEKIYGEDFEFNTRALYFAQRTMAIDTIVAKFLQSEGSITRSNAIEKKKKYVQDLIEILRRINTFRQEQLPENIPCQTDFFEERMVLTNIDIFYQMFKHNFPFTEVIAIKKLLVKENLFKVKYSVTDRKKDLFRKFMLNYNFFFFRIILALKKI